MSASLWSSKAALACCAPPGTTHTCWVSLWPTWCREHCVTWTSGCAVCAGSFNSLPASEALLYGALTAANAATMCSLSRPMAAAASAALQAGAFDRGAPLLQRSRRLLSAITGSSSSSSGAGDVVCGSLSSSYAWLRCLGDLPGLSDVHLDLPLVMPGQVCTCDLHFSVRHEHGVTACSVPAACWSLQHLQQHSTLVIFCCLRLYACVAWQCLPLC